MKKMKSTCAYLFTWIVLLSYTCSEVNAQISKQKLNAKASHFAYEEIEYGEQVQVTPLDVWLSGQHYLIASAEEEGPFVPGYAQEFSLVNLGTDSAYNYTKFYNSSSAELYEVASALQRNDIKYDTVNVEEGLTKYTCSINSNSLVFWVQDYQADVTPMPYYGRFRGILISFWRNGQERLRLKEAQVDKNASRRIAEAVEGKTLVRVSYREMSNLKKQKLVITHRIFDQVQLCWGKTDDYIAVTDVSFESIPYDSVLHYAGGTLALKKVKLPALPKHYQTFIELHQQSNGDAYDRTGSVFVVPNAYSGPTFFEGINEHPDSLPVFHDKKGQKYQGIMMQRWVEGEHVLYYQPPVELMRFFTPFGVGHFNDRVKIDGLEWENETYYKQEITDLSGYVQGDEILIGVWIGNYDGGGHKVTLDIKSYPGDYYWSEDNSAGDDELCKSLFNTCNVLEMAGQNYGRLFGTDSLTVDFYIPAEGHYELRYLSTGHGGWGGGDEFNPKTNKIIVDDKEWYAYTPWREDCGCYRKYNPVSGNFWNGMSSSDFSRSGWCPGTATQPVYFDFSSLSPGNHTLKLAIPQGEDQSGSFSHWSVSGVLIPKHN